MNMKKFEDGSVFEDDPPFSIEIIDESQAQKARKQTGSKHLFNTKINLILLIFLSLSKSLA